MARSHGSETAQLLARRCPDDVAVLVLGVPTYVVVQAYPGDGSAWMVGGRPVPFHPEGWPCGAYLRDAPTAIPLENSPGPVMTVAGGRDEIWPSVDFARVIERHSAQQHRRTETLVYPEAGHGVGVLVAQNTAGTAEDAARRDAWSRVRGVPAQRWRRAPEHVALKLRECVMCQLASGR